MSVIPPMIPPMAPPTDNLAVFVASISIQVGGEIIFGLHTTQNAGFIYPGRPIDTNNILNFALCDRGVYILSIMLNNVRSTASGVMEVFTMPAGKAFPSGNVTYPGPGMVGDLFFIFSLIVETTLTFEIRPTPFILPSELRRVYSDKNGDFDDFYWTFNKIIKIFMEI